MPHRVLFSAASIVAFLFSAQLAAQFPEVLYTLQDGSTLVDDCVECDRMPIEVAIEGTLVLKRLPVRIVGELYQISKLDLRCSDCPEGSSYVVQGEGSHYRRDPETQETTLTVSVNGVEGIVLNAPSGDSSAPWPAIDVKVTEEAPRDPFHRITLRIIAAPEVELARYELVDGNLEDGSGSILQVVCPVCRPANPMVPLRGELLVGLIHPVDDGFSVYRLDAIRLESLLPEVERPIRGSGTYQQGGDSEELKQMRLTVEINGKPLRELIGGPVPVAPGAAFPVIDMEVEETFRDTLWYRIRLVAKPAAASRFRRGDSNSDGGVDVSDPVFHLHWSFNGGPAPTCLDAADSDANGVHDLTDAVFTLNYLFLSGLEPPAPGPLACGEAKEPRFGCESQPSCAGGG